MINDEALREIGSDSVTVLVGLSLFNTVTHVLIKVIICHIDMICHTIISDFLCRDH